MRVTVICLDTTLPEHLGETFYLVDEENDGNAPVRFVCISTSTGVRAIFEASQVELLAVDHAPWPLNLAKTSRHDLE